MPHGPRPPNSQTTQGHVWWGTSLNCGCFDSTCSDYIVPSQPLVKVTGLGTSVTHVEGVLDLVQSGSVLMTDAVSPPAS